MIGFVFHLATGAVAALDHPDEAVEAGRDALDGWWGYPWYNDATDDVAPVPVRQPADYSWLNFNPGLNWPTSLLEWLVWIGIALVFLLIVYLLVQAYRSRGAKSAAVETARRQPKRDDTERIEALPFPMRSGQMDLLSEARRHYERGDYRQAIVYLFSYQLVHLDRRHWIRLARGKTNRQYLRELGPRQALRRLVEETMIAFEDVFFGNRALQRERFERCWFRLGEFESLAEERALGAEA